MRVFSESVYINRVVVTEDLRDINKYICKNLRPYITSSKNNRLQFTYT